MANTAFHESRTCVDYFHWSFHKSSLGFGAEFARLRSPVMGTFTLQLQRSASGTPVCNLRQHGGEHEASACAAVAPAPPIRGRLTSPPPASRRRRRRFPTFPPLASLS